MGQKKTGNTLATVFTYTLLRNEQPMSQIQYSILDAFPGYPAISSDTYRTYTYEQATARAAALVETIDQCNEFEVLNQPVGFGDCPETE